MATPARDTSGFLRASHQSQALCLGTLGVSGLLWPIAVWGFPSPLRFLAAWSAAGAGVWLLTRARRHWRLHEMELDLTDGDGFNPERIAEAVEVAHSNLPVEVLANAQYQRLRDVVENPHSAPGSQRKPWGVVRDACVKDGQLVSYTIVTKKGLLTDKKQATDRCNQLSNLLAKPDGSEWFIEADPTEDQIEAKLLQDRLPGAIAPEPPDSAVQDLADAQLRYSSARWMLGVDAQGNEVSYPVDEDNIPHVLVAGGTGGGKSVWARTTIEMFRVNGFTCFIASGKATDFAMLNGLPGIGMVAVGSAQTAVMCRTIRKEMDRRYLEENRRAAAGAEKSFNYPPILMLLDEWGTTEIEMRSRYTDSTPFLNDVDILLRKGRECKIHVVLLSQNIRKQGPGAVPGAWQHNLRLTIALGEPENVTITSDAFTPEARPEVRRIGPRLKGKAGRGITAERETSRVLEFQSYYGWSPGTTSLDPLAPRKVRAPSEEVREVWKRWVPISSSVPLLMPRRGIVATGPDWEEGELDDVANTPTIALTDASGTSIPDRQKYDPWNANWVGAGSEDTGFNGIDFDC